MFAFELRLVNVVICVGFRCCRTSGACVFVVDVVFDCEVFVVDVALLIVL